jgi:ribosomal protein S18 acetylase RimI-like enzyme
MNIRAATGLDVPAILPMVRAICAMHEEMDGRRYDYLPDVVERYQRWLPGRATDGRSVLVVGEMAEHVGAPVKLAGFLVGTVEGNIPIYRTMEFGFIHDVWVEPWARRSGLGGKLVDAAVAKFAAIGVTQIRLETAAGNDAAGALFARHGFRVAASEMQRDM